MQNMYLYLYIKLSVLRSEPKSHGCKHTVLAFSCIFFQKPYYRALKPLPPGSAFRLYRPARRYYQAFFIYLFSLCLSAQIIQTFITPLQYLPSYFFRQQSVCPILYLKSIIYKQRVFFMYLFVLSLVHFFSFALFIPVKVTAQSFQLCS